MTKQERTEVAEEIADILRDSWIIGDLAWGRTVSKIEIYLEKKFPEKE
jgi:hypothetical protein